MREREYALILGNYNSKVSVCVRERDKVSSPSMKSILAQR